MPTPKQVRLHFKKVSNARNKLATALYEAHKAKVLVYDNALYSEQSPCATLFGELDARIKATTDPQLAKAMREEITGAV